MWIAIEPKLLAIEFGVHLITMLINKYSLLWTKSFKIASWRIIKVVNFWHIVYYILCSKFLLKVHMCQKAYIFNIYIWDFQINHKSFFPIWSSNTHYKFGDFQSLLVFLIELLAFPAKTSIKSDEKIIHSSDGRTNSLWLFLRGQSSTSIKTLTEIFR